MIAPLYAALLLVTSAAQVQPTQDNAPATTAPNVAAANRAEQQNVDARNDAQAAVSVDRQAQYAADVLAYDQARIDRRETIHHEQAYYDRERRAYAAAMADWRVQADACKRGHTRACNAPAPRPGDYM